MLTTPTPRGGDPGGMHARRNMRSRCDVFRSQLRRPHARSRSPGSIAKTSCRAALTQVLFLRTDARQSAVSKPSDERQRRPGVVDGADLDVDQAAGEPEVTDMMLIEIGLLSAGQLGPTDP